MRRIRSSETDIAKIGKCTIVYGPIEMDIFASLMKKYRKGGKMDTNLSQRLQTTLVIGMPEDLDALPAHPKIQKRLAEIEQQITQGE